MGLDSKYGIDRSIGEAFLYPGRSSQSRVYRGTAKVCGQSLVRMSINCRNDSTMSTHQCIFITDELEVFFSCT